MSYNKRTLYLNLLVVPNFVAGNIKLISMKVEAQDYRDMSVWACFVL